jgi:hypothetical protein
MHSQVFSISPMFCLPAVLAPRLHYWLRPMLETAGLSNNFEMRLFVPAAHIIRLAALGERFNLTQVVEVAGSVQLAGEHGARIRSSLSAKAESLRHRQMSEIEAAANSSTERMGVPMVLLFLAFIVLIGYPAVTLIVGGL